MDPLSITASALTLIDAAVEVAKAIQTVRDARHLPSEFSSLRAEVADLHFQLEHCQSFVRNNRQVGAKLRACGLLRYTEAAKDKLDLLQTVIAPNTSPIGLASRKEVKAYWTAVVHGKSRMCSFRDQLRDLRLNLASSLGVLTAPVVFDIDTKLDGIVDAQKDFQSVQSQLLQDLISLNKKAIESLPRPPPAYADTLQVNTTEPLLATEATAMTRNRPHNSSAKDLVTTRYPLPNDALGQYCLPWCSCQCHSTTSVGTVDSLRHVFGQLSVSQNSMPCFAKACNQKQCRRKISPKLNVRYRFPRAVAGFQYLTCSFTTFAGPELRIKLPRLRDWTSPVWQYAVDGNVRAVERMFRAGLASPWDVSPVGRNLLHFVANHWNADLCRLLVDANIDVEAEDDFQDSGVCIAWDKVLSGRMTANDASTVASLFSNTDHLSTRGFTTVHKIVLGLVKKDLDYELVCDTGDIDTKDSKGRTPVSWAAARGDEAALNTLLSHGADSNIKDKSGNSPMHYVRNTTCAELLLTHGADAKAVNNYRETTLYRTSTDTQSASLTEFLIAAGVDVNAADAFDQTPLHNIVGESMPWMHVLLDAGADINARNSSGDTPLRLAVMYNCHPIIRRVLDRHAEANFGVINHYGQSFAHTIARIANSETMAMLADARPETLKPYFDLRDNAGKTAADYFAERLESLDAQDALVLKESYDKFVKAVSESAKEVDVSAVVADIVMQIGLKMTPEPRITELEAFDEEDDVAEVFHDATEDFTAPSLIAIAC